MCKVCSCCHDTHTMNFPLAYTQPRFSDAHHEVWRPSPDLLLSLPQICGVAPHQTSTDLAVSFVPGTRSARLVHKNLPGSLSQPACSPADIKMTYEALWSPLPTTAMFSSCPLLNLTFGLKTIATLKGYTISQGGGTRQRDLS